MPRESLQTLLDLPLPTLFIYGNGEIAVLEAMAGKEPSSVPEQHRPVVHWTAAQLAQGPEAMTEALPHWPKTTTVQIPSLGDVLFCHATPRDENEILTKLTDENQLLPAFAGIHASTVVCGHTHMQFQRRIGDTRVINAGSVGMPFGSTGADWLLIDDDKIQFRHTNYGLDQAADRIRQSDYPQANTFVERYLLHPPTEADMLSAFSQPKRA
jgi:diadenosine tetraphosphatase ApaH/serine/threonine PP2A family protein phosphatase